MMSSMWQRWTTTPTQPAAAAASDDCLPDNHMMEEGLQTSLPLQDDSDNDSLPRQVHVGLSIDSSVQTETSSLSDLDEGMPLWAKSPPRSYPLDAHSAPLEVPMGELQIPMPQRVVSIDNNSITPQTLIQRSKGSNAISSLPVFPMVRREEDIHKLDPFQLQQHQQSKKGQKLIRLFCAVLALGLMAVSVHPLDYDSILPPNGTGRPDLPTFETQSLPQLATFDSNNNNNSGKKSTTIFRGLCSSLAGIASLSTSGRRRSLSTNFQFESVRFLFGRVCLCGNLGGNGMEGISKVQDASNTSKRTNPSGSEAVQVKE